MSVAQYARLKESRGPGNNFGFIQGTQGIITLKELRESGNNIGHLYFRMETRHLSALEHVYYHWNLTLIWNLDKRSVKLRDDFIAKKVVTPSKMSLVSPLQNWLYIAGWCLSLVPTLSLYST